MKTMRPIFILLSIINSKIREIIKTYLESNIPFSNENVNHVFEILEKKTNNHN